MRDCAGSSLHVSPHPHHPPTHFEGHDQFANLIVRIYSNVFFSPTSQSVYIESANLIERCELIEYTIITLY